MNNNKIPELLLEKYILNELSPSQHQRIDNAVKNDASVQKRIDELKNSNLEIMQKYPAEMFTNIVQNRLNMKSGNKQSVRASSFSNKIKIAVPAFTTLMLLSAIFYFNNFNNGIDSPEDIRIKGIESSAKLNIFKKTENETVMLHPEEIVQANDLIQLQYFTAGKNYGVIFSVDGNKNITKHYPYSETDADTILESNKNILLQNSYLLDNAPNYEIFFFIISDKVIDIKYIKENLKKFAVEEKNIENAELKFDREYTIIKYPLKKRKQ